ncbi:MAG: hypothetical protein CBC19_06355 [Oceanospirillales bacterium TMED59]|nr:MAG: hypothetical protein CBC19_06355 [Oceanospirillales bacterium TMED59]
MFMRGARVTFTNELMKNSVVSFMSQNTDLRNDMMLTFRVHLSDNALLLVQLFPSEGEAAEYDKGVAPLVEQIRDMGAKIDMLSGDSSHFKVAGDLRLNQLHGEAR